MYLDEKMVYLYEMYQHLNKFPHKDEYNEMPHVI